MPFITFIILAAGMFITSGCGAALNADTAAAPVIESKTTTAALLKGPEQHELYTHCGLYTAYYDNRQWKAVNPTDGQSLSGASNTTTGTMTLISNDLLRFNWEGGSADFRPVDIEPAPCI